MPDCYYTEAFKRRQSKSRSLTCLVQLQHCILEVLDVQPLLVSQACASLFSLSFPDYLMQHLHGWVTRLLMLWLNVITFRKYALILCELLLTSLQNSQQTAIPELAGSHIDQERLKQC